MRNNAKHHILNALVTEWGVSKSLQIVLLAVAAASIVVVIGTSVIPNKTNKEIDTDEFNEQY